MTFALLNTLYISQYLVIIDSYEGVINACYCVLNVGTCVHYANGVGSSQRYTSCTINVCKCCNTYH